VSGIYFDPYYYMPGYVEADGNLNGSYAYVSAFENPVGIASATISFQTIDTFFLDILASLGGMDSGLPSVYLFDSTTGAMLFSLLPDIDYYLHGHTSLTQQIPVVSFHVYTITAYADGTNLDPSDAFISVTAIPSAVQEPGMLTIFSIGLMGIGLIRRRFSRI
jgi:hypothetical protein